MSALRATTGLAHYFDARTTNALLALIRHTGVVASCLVNDSGEERGPSTPRDLEGLCREFL